MTREPAPRPGRGGSRQGPRHPPCRPECVALPLQLRRQHPRPRKAPGSRKGSGGLALFRGCLARMPPRPDKDKMAGPAIVAGGGTRCRAGTERTLPCPYNKAGCPFPGRSAPPYPTVHPCRNCGLFARIRACHAGSNCNNCAIVC